MRVIFKPVGILSGILAGMIGKKIFELVWAVIDDGDAPQPNTVRSASPSLCRRCSWRVRSFVCCAVSPITVPAMRSRA